MKLEDNLSKEDHTWVAEKTSRKPLLSIQLPLNIFDSIFSNIEATGNKSSHILREDNKNKMG